MIPNSHLVACPACQAGHLLYIEPTWECTGCHRKFSNDEVKAHLEVNPHPRRQGDAP